MVNDNKYGILLANDIKLHRKYFEELVKLLGIQVVYRAPRPGKHYTKYTEIESNYEKPMKVGCIFNEHIDQRTMKKLGWNTELINTMSLISVPYDLPGIQQGVLFVIPSGLDDGKGRLFRTVMMSNIMIYPASLTCGIVPEYEDTFESSNYNHENNSFNLLNEEVDVL